MSGRLLKLLVAASCAVVLAGMASPARAATVTYDVLFAAAGFGTGAPVSPVLGQFHLTFDPSGDASSTTGVVVDHLNLSIGQVGFDYVQSTDFMQIGGSINGVPFAFAGTDDLVLLISNFTSANPTFGFFMYSQTATLQFLTFNGAVFVTPTTTPVAATPIPAALPLFAAALGGLGFAGWRRARKAA